MVEKMKKNVVWYAALSVLLILTACAKEEQITSQDKGKVMVDLLSDLSFPLKGSTSRAVDLLSYSNVNNYTVEIVNSNGAIIQSKLYSEMDLVQEVAPGTYTIRAFYGENLPAAYDKLYVSGEQLFTVAKGDTKKVSFVCKPANTKVKIAYSDDFFNFYSDCTVGLKTKHIDTPFLMGKGDRDKELFLKSDAAGEMLTLTFDLKDLKGVSVTPDNFGAQTVTIKPRDFLTISMKPKLIDVEGGKITGITVTVDTGLTEEVIDVIIPDSFLPGEDTEVNN